MPSPSSELNAETRRSLGLQEPVQTADERAPAVRRGYWDVVMEKMRSAGWLGKVMETRLLPAASAILAWEIT